MTKKRQYIYQCTATSDHKLAAILEATSNVLPGLLRHNYRLTELETTVIEQDGEFTATVIQKYGYAPQKRNTKLVKQHV